MNLIHCKEKAAATRWVLLSGGGLLIALGALGCARLTIGAGAIDFLFAGTRPMPMQSAVGFLLAGLVMLGILIEIGWVRKVCGTALLLSAIVGMGYYVSGYGVAVMAMMDEAGTGVEKAPWSAWMVSSPGVLLSFLSAGGLGLVWPKLERRSDRALVLSMIGAASVAVGFSGLCGYATGVPSAFSWGVPNEMSMVGAMSVTFFGALHWFWGCEEGRGERSEHWWISLPLAFGMALMTLSFWEALRLETTVPTARMVLIVGLLGSGVLPLAVHFAQVARSRALLFERQNEALTWEVLQKERVEQNLTASENLKRRIIECNNDVVTVVDRSGTILSMEQWGNNLLEKDLGKGPGPREWVLHFDESSRVNALEALEQARQGKSATFQACSSANGPLRWWDVTVAPLNAAAGVVDRVLAISRDVTGFKRVEGALRESEERFRRIFEHGPMGMVLIDLEFRVTKINSAFGRILGYSPEDIVERSLADFAYPADVLPLMQHLKRIFSKEGSGFQLEMRCFTKSRDVVWVAQTGSVIATSEGCPVSGVVIFESINERKLAETKFNAYQEQLQSLASELSLSEERERRRIATTLHDRIGQTLAFAKLKLGAMSQAAAPAGVRPTLTEVRKLIEQAIADTRSLTFEVSPPVLYELGLVAALEWLAQKATQEHGISSDFVDDGEAKPLDEKFKVALFQAARELLVNVVKHAQAKHVQISVRTDGDAIRIVIEDDGVGFDLAKKQSAGAAQGFGLFNIRERLSYLGGQMKIRSEIGRGTRITLLAPLELSDAVKQPL